MDKNKIDGAIEKYRFWIGGVLTVVILTGCGVLFWRENIAKPSFADRISQLEDRVDKLENNQETIINEQTSSNAQSLNIQALNIQPQDTGEVAGVGTETTKIPDQVRNDSSAVVTPQGKINLNTASQSQLELLPGIGPVTAGYIIDYRNQHGGFKSIGELDNVKNIGQKTIEKFKDLVSL